MVRTHVYLDERLSPGLATAGTQLINQAATAAAAGANQQGLVSVVRVSRVAIWCWRLQILGFQHKLWQLVSGYLYSA
jgi:hypothetical protein